MSNSRIIEDNSLRPKGNHGYFSLVTQYLLGFYEFSLTFRG